MEPLSIFKQIKIYYDRHGLFDFAIFQLKGGKRGYTFCSDAIGIKWTEVSEDEGLKILEFLKERTNNAK